MSTVDKQEGELALVFEYAEWTMRTVIDFHKREQSRIPEYTVKSMIWQALKGLHYTHENWVIHRDLKPQNMLVSCHMAGGVAFLCVYVVGLLCDVSW
jgi:serine/threonine protein kinase